MRGNWAELTIQEKKAGRFVLSLELRFSHYPQMLQPCSLEVPILKELKGFIHRRILGIGTTELRSRFQ